MPAQLRPPFCFAIFNTDNPHARKTVTIGGSQTATDATNWFWRSARKQVGAG
jgi:hypothetical protein